MSISPVCLHQRLKERKQLKLVLAGTFIGSVLLHIAIGYSANYWRKEWRQVEAEPIELIMVEAPQPIEKPKAIAKAPAVKLKSPEKVTTTKILKIPQPTIPTEPEIVKQKPVKNLPSLAPEKPNPLVRELEPLPAPKPEPTEPQELKLTAKKPIDPQPDRSSTKVKRTPTRGNSARNPKIDPPNNSPLETENIRPTQAIDSTVARSNSTSDRNFRNNFGNTSNPSNTLDGGNGENENPGSVVGNRAIARNNFGGTAVQRSGGDRNFRNNLSNGNSNENGGENNNTGNGEEPGNIAANNVSFGDRGDSEEVFSQTEVACIRNCQPKYPRGLKKIQARPVVRIEMTADGKPISASIVTSSGYLELDEAVRQMAMEMEFSPPGRSGTLRLRFLLPKG